MYSRCSCVQVDKPEQYSCALMCSRCSCIQVDKPEQYSYALVCSCCSCVQVNKPEQYSYALVCSRCSCVQVDKPEQYSYDRPSLLESVLTLMLLLASVPYKNAGTAFVEATAQEPDLDLGVLNQVCAFVLGQVRTFVLSQVCWAMCVLRY